MCTFGAPRQLAWWFLTQRNCKMLALNRGSQLWLHIRSTWGVFKILLLKCPLRIFPVDANAAARVENHCTKLEFPFWTLRTVILYSAAALGEKAQTTANLQEYRGSLGALRGYSRLCGGSSWSCDVLKWLSKWFSLPPPTLLSGNLPSLDPVLCPCHKLIT